MGCFNCGGKIVPFEDKYKCDKCSKIYLTTEQFIKCGIVQYNNHKKTKSDDE